MISAFPKIFAIGSDYIRDIFDEEVEITEKIDGSQFVFGKVDGELYMRSKGIVQYKEKHDKMFDKAVDYVLSIYDIIPDNTVFYCEYLQKPKHNVLVYERVPKNFLMLFGVSSKGNNGFVNYCGLKTYAQQIGIEVVPLIFNGKITNPEGLIEFLKTDSILGSVKIEGVVVKNYDRAFLLGGQPIPLMAGKFVSEAFKETHRESWGRDNTTKGRYQTFVDSFKTEARWQKAIQHLEERSELEHSPRDIGKILKEVQNDIEAEEEQNIKEFLYKEFKGDILRTAIKGFPEYYKEQLLKRCF